MVSTEAMLHNLGQYDSMESVQFSHIFASHNDYDLKIKAAVLVQSANRLENIISPQMRNVIKREILKTLSVATEETPTDFAEDSGEYLGLENDRQEFKSSFFIAPQNAKEQSQPVNIMSFHWTALHIYVSTVSLSV